MTTTLTITSGQTSFTAQNYTILPSPGTVVPDGVAPLILSAAQYAGVVLSSSAGTGVITVPSRRFSRSGVGPPVAGEGFWLLGDEVVDSTSAEFECSAPGNPGTWTTAQSGSFALVCQVAGDGTSDDAAAIQAKITAASNAGGGRVIVPRGSSGVVVVGSTLVHPSNVTLEIASGVTLRRKAGFLGNLIQNTGAVPARTVADGAITSGQNTLTSATASFTSADNGRAVGVAGAGIGGSLLYATMTYVNATTVTLSVNASTTVAGASCSIYGARDSNITLIVGAGATIDGGNNDGGLGTRDHHLLYRRVDGLSVTGAGPTSSLVATAGKYFIAPGDVSRCVVGGFMCAVNSAPVQADGFVSQMVVRDLWGTAGDDAVSFTPNNYLLYNDVIGNQSDVLIENINVASNSVVVKVLGGNPATSARRFLIRNPGGSGANNGIWIGDDAAQATTIGGLVDQIVVQDVRTTAPNSKQVVILTGTNLGRVELDGITFQNTAATGSPVFFNPATPSVLPSLTIRRIAVSGIASGPVINVASTGTVTRLLVDGVSIDTATAPTVVFVSGTVTDLTVRGVRGTATGALYVVALNGAAAVATRVILDDIHLVGPGALSNLIGAVTAGQTVGVVEMSNVAVTGTGYLWDLNTTTTVLLSNVSTTSCAGIGNNRSAAVVTVAGNAGGVTKGTNGVLVNAGGKVSVQAWDMPPSTQAGGFPTVAGGAGLGTTPTVSVTGSDRAGSVSLALGTGPAAGVQATVTFAGAWPQAPKVSLTPTNSPAQAVGAYVSSKTATGFVVSTTNTPGGTMTFDYVVAA